MSASVRISCDGIWEHKSGVIPGFTRNYKVNRLVWFELHDDWEAAFRRGKQIKEWKRAWKFRLIESDNPDWIDRYYDFARST